MQHSLAHNANIEQSKEAQLYSQEITQTLLPSSAQQNWQLSQPHLMPTPSPSPWNPNEMSWVQANQAMNYPGVIQFIAHNPRVLNIHQKRKSDEPMPQAPVKQFISEEKITAHFNGLHISSNHISNENSMDNNGIMNINSEVPSGKCFTNLTYEDYQMTAKQLAEKLKAGGNIIKVCEEAKQLSNTIKPLVPNILMQQYQKPCMALIPYVPPNAVLLPKKNEKLLMSKKNEKKSVENDDLEIDEFDDFLDNNNTCQMDFNQLNSNNMDEDL